MDIKKTPSLMVVATAIYLATFLSSGLAISKCQDENGKWHYGASVSSKCAKSEITNLNNRGVVKDKVAAPKTTAQLDAEKSSKEEAAKVRELENAEADEKNLILSVYEKEADIERARQNNLRSINQQVVLRNAYIKSLKENRALKEKKIPTISSKPLQERVRQQIVDIDDDLEESRGSAEELQEKITAVNIRYDKELELFRKYNSPKQ